MSFPVETSGVSAASLPLDAQSSAALGLPDARSSLALGPPDALSKDSVSLFGLELSSSDAEELLSDSSSLAAAASPSSRWATSLC